MRRFDGPETWTLGPDYPVASCRRCGASANEKDVATGFCWRCGYLGAVEFKEHLDKAREEYREALDKLADK